MQTAYDKDACHTFFEGKLCMQMLPRECGVGDVSCPAAGECTAVLRDFVVARSRDARQASYPAAQLL